MTQKGKSPIEQAARAASALLAVKERNLEKLHAFSERVAKRAGESAIVAPVAFWDALADDRERGDAEEPYIYQYPHYDRDAVVL